jgi:hypothetical protein
MPLGTRHLGTQALSEAVPDEWKFPARQAVAAGKRFKASISPQSRVTSPPHDSHLLHTKNILPE